jgi:hypothetical protein
MIIAIILAVAGLVLFVILIKYNRQHKQKVAIIMEENRGVQKLFTQHSAG